MTYLRFILQLTLLLGVLSPNTLAGGRIEIPEGPTGYFTVPDAIAGTENVHPLVILIHDWWGLDPYWVDTAEKLKNNGFAVFVMDLYEGALPRNPMDAFELSQKVDETEVVKDLKLALDFFQDYPAVNSNRLGVLGWSRGATLALRFTLSEPKRIHALGLYYGQGINKEAIEQLKVPLIGFYGGNDRGIPQDEIDLFTVRLEDQRKRFKIYSYPEAAHGFFHPASESYDVTVVQDTWQKMLDFFKVNLA